MTYATDAFRNVVLLGTFHVSSIAIDFAILALYGVITTALSIMLFKSRLE